MDGIIIGLLGFLVWRWLKDRVPSEPEMRGRYYAMPFSRPIIVSGLVGAVIGLIVSSVFALAIIFARDATGWLLAVLGIALFTCISLWILLELFVSCVSFDEHRIYHRNCLGRVRVVAWSELTEYRYSEVQDCYLLRTRTSGWLKVSAYRSGIEAFAKLVKARVPLRDGIGSS